jgi:protein tyrosine/serine phosphatase
MYTTTTPLHRSLLSAHIDENMDLSQITVPDQTAEEKAFLARTATLCEERNLPLEKVKNARDLASVCNSPILPGKVFRIGRVSDATEKDLDILFGQIGVKTLVDLRSPTELKDDPTLEREEVFSNFTDMVYYESGKLVKELGPEEKRMQRKRKRDRVREAVSGARKNTHDVVVGFVDNFFRGEEGEEDDEDEECVDCIAAEKLLQDSARRRNRKERHFVSIMNEVKYVRGTLSKVRKRDIAKTIIKSPTAIISKTARENIKKPFLDEINGGGLPMLNELLLRFGAPGIKYVLDLVSDKSRHPVAFYCTAGKDRTGMIAAIILALLGTEDEYIVEDYSLSANVYAEMNDHKAMVGALSQRSLDAKTFLGAPPQVMKDTLENIRRTYGSVEGYCDYIGFDANSRERLKYALTEP